MKPIDPLEHALWSRCVRVLAANWRSGSTVPAGRLYPHQWSWDSAFIAIGLRHWAPGRAAQELRSLVGGQWDDGRVPHIVFNPRVADDAYFPGPAFWRTGFRAGTPPVETSGIVQPPVHAVAALRVAAKLSGEARARFVRSMLPHLLAQSDYLHRRRLDPGTGLVVILHPWESGLDNSPAWDEPLVAVPADPALLTTYTRRDLDHADAADRPTGEDYARYIRLALAYRDHSYDDAWALRSAEFCVADPAFNALWAWSELALADLISLAVTEGLTNRPAESGIAEHRRAARQITVALVERLWSHESGMFHALDVRSGRLQPARTVGGLIPLLLPDLPRRIVDDLVEAACGDAFAVGSGTVHGVPSHDLTAETFTARRYWRGPAWVNTTWLFIQGLRLHGRDRLARALRDDLVRLTSGSGLCEYFDVHSGAGHGSKDFSWTAALMLDLLAS